MIGIAHRMAGAPITWGVCEVPGWGVQLDPDRVLDEMAEIGLRATELGPDGFLPADTGSLRTLLEERELALVGGFHPIVLHRRDGLEERLASVGREIDRLANAGAGVLVLAAASSNDGYERSSNLDAREWEALCRAIDRVVEIASEREMGVTLHPHHGTVIAGPGDVDRLLETTDASLCLDTGHLLVGGIDPLELARSAPGRVAHVHLKDVDATKAEKVRTGGVGYRDAVKGGMYRPLGEGDLDIAAIVRALEGSGYRGWYVLEQDTVLERAPDAGGGPMNDAMTSFEFLRRVAEQLDDASPAGEAGGERAARGAPS